ncbi:hypothetical protein C8Q78DRAFT_1047162 [Trametes maxima]|nr:hypothetical protein C8Q78DRAFT_1047162 [Trametes maxima]
MTPRHALLYSSFRRILGPGGGLIQQIRTNLGAEHAWSFIRTSGAKKPKCLVQSGQNGDFTGLIYQTDIAIFGDFGSGILVDCRGSCADAESFRKLISRFAS